MIDRAPSRHLPIDPVLILSTGRCGSTMISEVLSRHPRVLSLSEFFVPLGIRAFARRTLDGEGMWRILSRQSPGLHAMLKDGHVVEEGLYPHDAPGSRFTAATLPPILAVALPHLTERHEALYDELDGVVRSWPRMPLAEHYRALFGYLAERFDRRVWVERSGGSLMHAAKLLRLFPEARVVHVYRDGRDTALSMRRHRNFKVLVGSIAACRRFGIDPTRAFRSPTSGRPDVWLEDLVFRLLDIDKLTRHGPGLAEFGAFWSRLVEIGDEVLGSLPQERLLNLRLEDAQRAPKEELRRLIRFIDPSLEDEAWLAEVSALPKPTPSKAASLPAGERLALTRACAPGLELLGYAP